MNLKLVNAVFEAGEKRAEEHASIMEWYGNPKTAKVNPYIAKSKQARDWVKRNGEVTQANRRALAYVGALFLREAFDARNL